MSENQAFRDAVKGVVKAYDVDADALRALARDLEALADDWESTEEKL